MAEDDNPLPAIVELLKAQNAFSVELGSRLNATRVVLLALLHVSPNLKLLSEQIEKQLSSIESTMLYLPEDQIKSFKNELQIYKVAISEEEQLRK